MVFMRAMQEQRSHVTYLCMKGIKKLPGGSRATREKRNAAGLARMAIHGLLHEHGKGESCWAAMVSLASCAFGPSWARFGLLFLSSKKKLEWACI